MAKLDPNSSDYDRKESKTHQCEQEGQKLFAPIGFERFQSSTGNACIDVRMLCVSDPDGGDEQRVAKGTFSTSPKALWKLVEFCRAIGYLEPFDSDDDEAIGNILAAGYVLGTVTIDEYQGNHYAKVDKYDPAGDVEELPEWAEWIEAAEADFQEYMTWRLANPRGAPKQGGRGGAGRGGGNAGSSRGKGGGKSSTPF